MTVRIRLKRALATTLALAGLFTPLAACGGPSATAKNTGADGLTHLKWGYSLTDSAPILLGIQDGVFEKHGLKVDASEVGAADLVGGLISGSFDLSVQTGPGLALAVGQKVPITAVSGVTTFEAGAAKTTGSALLVAEDSDIKRPKDLEGKKVGVNLLKSASEFGVRQDVTDDGGDADKVEIVEIPFASARDGLAKGQIDAALVADPVLSQLLDSGAAKAPMGDPIEKVFGASPRLVITASKDWAAKNPKVVEQVQAAIKESLELAAKNPDRLLPIYEKHYKMTPAIAKATKLNAFKADIDPDSFAVINDVLVRYGALAKPVNSADLTVAP
ncbi:ABC transporter substrate-binding protein [Streptomyces sp. YC504]|uniref:ABC transporter substrate-binding protein n=1 Tax=Streptomyces mesophilus TaxID=1775132 RepID=A0A6G4XS14_9ACTN|nr:ABC transporter substrate-binding protein [Streptomyces mesophilus]NGO80389.1 ABC transporter substrate-binding protein [Streptomyces mesophilus]